MRRIGTAFMLLAGLSGCISFTATPTAGEKKSVEFKPTSTRMAAPAGMATAALPSNPTWTAHPGHDVAASTAIRPVSSYNPSVAPRVGGVPSLTPLVTTPRELPAGLAAATTPLPTVPPGYQVGYPTSAGGSTPAPVVQTSATAPAAPAAVRGEPTADRGTPPLLPAPTQEEIIRANLDEPAKPATLRPAAQETTEAPAAKESLSVAARTEKTGKTTPPLMRMVNTKRITLNFEVKDVGPSGLSTVELWYTQDTRDWKKYEAPTTAKAYVVEVDEEGMYGFTLVARSGLGLGKEPPVNGDQPQVWVIVDLSKPEVQLGEIETAANGGTQQVTLHWKASDKNLGRSPVTIQYAEKEDGPWKVLAGNVENTGTFVWQMPKTTPRCYFRVEATDLAGNVGQSSVSRQVLLDSSTPSVSIINVQASSAP